MTLTRNDPVVFHFRIGKGREMKPKAGATVVFLPEERRFGLAMCCSKDRYSRRWGRKIATARAKNPKSRITNKRFDSTVEYKGDLEMDRIKTAACQMVWHAADAVRNPVGVGLLED